MNPIRGVQKRKAGNRGAKTDRANQYVSLKERARFERASIFTDRTGAPRCGCLPARLPTAELVGLPSQQAAGKTNDPHHALVLNGCQCASAHRSKFFAQAPHNFREAVQDREDPDKSGS